MQNTKLVASLVVVVQTVGGEMCPPIETSKIGKMGEGTEATPILTALLRESTRTQLFSAGGALPYLKLDTIWQILP